MGFGEAMTIEELKEAMDKSSYVKFKVDTNYNDYIGLVVDMNDDLYEIDIMWFYKKTSGYKTRYKYSIGNALMTVSDEDVALESLKYI